MGDYLIVGFILHMMLIAFVTGYGIGASRQS